MPPFASLPEHDAERLLVRINGLWEDAARSAASFTDAVEFAEQRRDGELQALVATLPGRSADHPGRAAAEQRFRQIVDAATSRRLADLDALVAELNRLEAELPAPMARWDAPVWQHPLPPQGATMFRMGSLTRSDSRSLRIPLLASLGAAGGFCIDSTGAGVEPAAVGVVLRMIAALPAGRRVLVVPGAPSWAAAVGEQLPPGTAGGVLADCAMQLDLAMMAAQAGERPPVLLPGLLVVPVEELLLGAQDYPLLDKMMAVGPRLGLAVVVIGPAGQVSSWAQIADPQMIPVVDAVIRDPWTGAGWDFQPDDGAIPASVIAVLQQRGRPS